MEIAKKNLFIVQNFQLRFYKIHSIGSLFDNIAWKNFSFNNTRAIKTPKYFQYSPAKENELFERFTTEFGLSEYDANILIDEKGIALYFNELCEYTKNYKQ